MDKGELGPAAEAAAPGPECGEWVFREGTKAASPMAEMARPQYWGGDEQAVVSELQAGSEAAFDCLITHYHGPVFRVLLQMLGNEADAADCTQEVFLKAFRGIRQFRRGSSLKTWLYRIAIREALNQRRWCWRHRRNESSIEARQDQTHPALDIPERGPDPFDQLATHEVQELVRRAISEVPEVFRGALILRDLEGLSYEEVAEVLDVSVGTIKSRILRGRRLLRDVLAGMLYVRPHQAHYSSRGLAGAMAGGEE